MEPLIDITRLITVHSSNDIQRYISGQLSKTHMHKLVFWYSFYLSNWRKSRLCRYINICACYYVFAPGMRVFTVCIFLLFSFSSAKWDCLVNRGLDRPVQILSYFGTEHIKTCLDACLRLFSDVTTAIYEDSVVRCVFAHKFIKKTGYPSSFQ